MSFEAGIPDSAVPVKICPPGKKSKDIVEREKSGSISISTATALKWPERPSSVPINRKPVNSATEADKRIRDAERADAQAVVLKQPHRGGSDDPRMGFPLGRFVAKAWARDADRANAALAAGASYAKDVRAVKVAYGLHVPGSNAEDARPAGLSDAATPEEIMAAKAARDGLERTLGKADELLREVMPRLPAAMVRLCLDNIEPAQNDHFILKRGLWLLACHYRHYDVDKYRG